MEVAVYTSKSNEIVMHATSELSLNSALQQDTGCLSTNATVQASTTLGNTDLSALHCSTASPEMTTNLTPSHPTGIIPLQSRLMTVQSNTNIDLDSSTLPPKHTEEISSHEDTVAELETNCTPRTSAASEPVCLSTASHTSSSALLAVQSCSPSIKAHNLSDPSQYPEHHSSGPVDVLLDPPDSALSKPVDVIDLSSEDSRTSRGFIELVGNSPVTIGPAIKTQLCIRDGSPSEEIDPDCQPVSSAVNSSSNPTILPDIQTKEPIINKVDPAHDVSNTVAARVVQAITSTASVPTSSIALLNSTGSLVTTSTYQPLVSVSASIPSSPTDPNTSSSQMPLTTAPLPSHFTFTVSPISPNGDFPAVQCNLPGFPLVFLQVLPLPGARTGENYTINVPIQLILHGISSAIASGGTANGGPIVLSIAPSGTPPSALPLPSSLSVSSHSVGAPSLTESTMSTASTESLTVSGNGPLVNSAICSTSVTCPTLQFSASASTVIPSTIGSIHFPGLLINSVSNHSNANVITGNNNKRMRAIAPKPSQKLAAIAPTNTSTSSNAVLPSSRPNATTICRSNTKRPIVVTTVCTTPTPTISVSNLSGTSVGSPQSTLSGCKSSQTKKVSIMPAGTNNSMSRHGRGRRKGICSTASNTLASLMPSLTLPNGLPSAASASGSTQSIMVNTKNDLNVNSHGSLQTLPTSSTTLPPLPAPVQQGNPVQPMFGNQPLLMPGPNGASVLSGPMVPTGQMPFLFGNPLSAFPTGGTGAVSSSSSSSGAPYLFPQPLPLPNGCSQFPVSMYNSVSCTTSVPLSTTGPMTVVRSLQTHNSGSLFPSGAPTALATVDPSSGVVTHFPAPCMPMAVPYSSAGPSSDPNSFNNLPTMLYSQSGLLMPNPSVSQGSVVYPVAGQPLLSTPAPMSAPPITASNASVICPSQSVLGQPFSNTFMSNSSTSTLLPNSTLTTPFQVPSTFTPIMNEQQAFVSSITAGFNLMQQHSSLLAPSLPVTTVTNSDTSHFTVSDGISGSAQITTTSETVPINSDPDNNNLVKDDLITLAWRLTQMKGNELATTAISDGQDLVKTADGGEENSMLDALFDTYANDQAYTYQTDLNCGSILPEVDGTELGNLCSSNEETDEIVLLDGKSPSSVSELRSDIDAYGSAAGTEESTGNADIDALLAAAAMVGAASGVGDAQSSVTVPVPCSSTFNTVSQQLDTCDTKATMFSDAITTPANSTVSALPNSVVCTTIISNTVQSTALLAPCSSACLVSTQTSLSADLADTAPINVTTSCLPEPMHSPKEADDILSADFFSDFAGSACPNAFTDQEGDDLTHFTEADEPTSLADVLGCNAEDAADLESVLGPDAHRLGNSDHVSDSFLQSLVNDSPGLEMGGAENEDADEVPDATRLFGSSFAVCDPTGEGPLSSDAEKVHANLPKSVSPSTVGDNFELDLDALTKSDCPLDTSALDNPIPVPSSQQVRSLFRNTVSNVAPHRPPESPRDLAQTMSADSKLFSLFDTGTKQNTVESHHPAPEDDFLAVDFSDAAGDYTTAEQFNEALLLLGPQPNSPVELSLDYEKEHVIETEHPEASKMTLDELACVTSSSNVSSALFFETEQEMYMTLEQVCDGEVYDIPQATMAKVTLMGHSTLMVKPIVETTVTQSPKLITEELTVATITHDLVKYSEQVLLSPLTGTVIDVHTSSCQFVSPASLSPLLSTAVETQGGQQDASLLDTSVTSWKSCGSKSEGSDEETTLAMRLDTEQNPEVKQVVSESQGNKHFRSSIKKRPMVRHTRSTRRQLRTRSVSLDTPLQLVASTPSRASASKASRRRSRRRLFSAPSQLPPSIVLSRRVHGHTSRYLSDSKSTSVSEPSAGSSDSQKLSSTVSTLPANAFSCLERPSFSIDEFATEPNKTQSILTVLASSSALIEAAADLGSDSDVSPVKSNLGLDTLDRMLKNCQRRSQQALVDSTESKSTLISSCDSDPAGASQSVAEQSTVPMSYNSEQNTAFDRDGDIPETDLCEITNIKPAEDPLSKSLNMERKSKASTSHRKAGTKRGKKKPIRQNRFSSLKGESSNFELSVGNMQQDLTESTTVSPPIGFHLPVPSLAPATGNLLFSSSERPHSFGLSSETIAATQSTHNPVPNGDFSRHLPQLILAAASPLFPNLPPSPVEASGHICDLCETGLPTLPKEKSHPDLPAQEDKTIFESQFESLSEPKRSQITEASIIPIDTKSADLIKSTHSGLSHRRRRKRRRQSQFVNKTTRIVPKSTETLMSLPVSKNAFDSIIITPIHLNKPPFDSSFARFAADTELPTFADVHSNGSVDAFTRKSDVWVSTTRPGPPLFLNSLKSSESEHKLETKSLSPTAMLDASSEVAETGSDRISLSSTTFHDEDKSNPVRSGCLSDVMSSPQLTVASSTGSVSLFDQPLGSFPALRIPPLSQTTQFSAIYQASKSTNSTTVLSTPSFLTSTMPFTVDTSIAGLKVPTASGLSSLVIPTTRVPGVTFGSFAGAAAFRSISFSALAARVECATDKRNSLLWTERLTFSDLAKVASKSTHATSSPTLNGGGQWGCEVEGSDIKTLTSSRLFQGCTLSGTERPEGTDAVLPLPTSSPRSNNALNAAPTLPRDNVSNVSSKQLDVAATTSIEISMESALTSTKVSHAPWRASRRRRRLHRSRAFRKRKVAREIHTAELVSAHPIQNIIATTPHIDSVDANCVCVRPSLKEGSLLPIDSCEPIVERTESPSKAVTEPSVVPRVLTPQNTCGFGPGITKSISNARPNSTSGPQQLHADSASAVEQSPTNSPHHPTSSAIQFEQTLSSPVIAESLPISIIRSENEPCKNELSVTSPVLVNEIITLPLDQTDCVALTTDSDLQDDSCNHPTSERLVTPSKGLELPESGMNETDMQLIEAEPDPSFTPVVAGSSDNIIEQNTKSIHLDTDVVSLGEVETAPSLPDSNPYPPIRLRLNLRLAAMGRSHVRAKKKKSKRQSAPNSTSMVSVSQPSTQVTAVISARTPTSLSIRLAPKPRMTRIPIVQRSLSGGATEPQPTTGSRRPRSRRRGRRPQRNKSDSLTTSVTIAPSGSMVHTDSIENSSKIVTPPTVQSNKISQAVVRPTCATRSSVLGQVPRTAYLGSVFAKRIFSTAKQDRRSSYAHLAQPWRSGLRGSPRKRGLLRSQPAPLNKSVSSTLQPTNLNSDLKCIQQVVVKSASPPNRISKRRGRGASGRGQSRKRLGKRALSLETNVDRVGLDTYERSTPSGDPPAIRLVIRLGNHLQRTQSTEREDHSRSSVSPLVTRSSSQDSYFVSEETALKQARIDQLGEETITEQNANGENSLLNTDRRDAVATLGAVEDDLTSTDELPAFEFCTATEAETYMDPNQVHIHRVINQAFTSQSSVGDCFLRSDDEDQNGGVVDVLLKSTTPIDPVIDSNVYTGQLSARHPCLSKTNTYPHKAPPRVGYACSATDESGSLSSSRGKQKRKNRSDSTAVGKRRCSGPVQTIANSHSPPSNSVPDSSSMSLVSTAGTLGSSRYRSVNNHQASDGSDHWTTSMPKNCEPTSALNPTREFHQGNAVETHQMGYNVICHNNMQAPVATAVDASTTEKSSDIPDRMPHEDHMGHPVKSYHSLSHTPSSQQRVSAALYSHNHTIPGGTSSGAGASCGEGRSSSSTSSIVSVPALASVGSPVRPESQSDYPVSSRMAPSPATRDECVSGLRALKSSSLHIQGTSSVSTGFTQSVSPAASFADQRTASGHSTVSPYRGSGYPTEFRPLDSGDPMKAHRSHSPSTIALSFYSASTSQHLSQEKQLGESMLHPQSDAGNSSTNSVHQQALAAATAYAAAAAYAGLDPMVAAHQRVKAYYDHCVSSLFGSLATNPSVSGAPSGSSTDYQNPITTRSTEWSTNPTDRTSSERSFDPTTMSRGSWVWSREQANVRHCNQGARPAGLFDTDPRLGEYNSGCHTRGGTLSNYPTTLNNGAPNPSQSTNLQQYPYPTTVAKESTSIDYGFSTGHSGFNLSSCPDPLLPHLTHPDPYRQFHPGFDYTRLSAGSVHEPRINGWS